MKRVISIVLLLVCLSLVIDLGTAQRKHEFIKNRIHDFEETHAKVRYSTATGTAHLVTETQKTLTKRSTYDSVSEGLEAFLAAHPEIGVTDVKTQLVKISRRKDAQIKTLAMITYQQVHKGLIVDGCLLKVNINQENRVVSTSGTIVPAINLDVVPRISENEAIALARPALPNDMTFTIANAKLEIYRTDMTSGKMGTNHLAYHIIFKCTQHLESHYVYVDAHDGTVLNSFSPVYHALNRTAIVFNVGTVFTEGNTLPENEQARLALEINAVQYDAMLHVGGWDGWDLKGGEFRNTIDVPTNGFPGFECPNAAFYGAPIGALYCPGFAYAIDVIAHEFGHGYVEGIVGSGGLVYYGQSGALNEAFADIMGESMQILLKAPVEYPPRIDRNCTIPDGNQRWVVCDNLPIAQQDSPNIFGDNIGFRDMYNPSCYRDPASTVDPNFFCDPNVDNGGVHINSGVLNQVYSLFVDGGDFQGTTVTGVGLTKAFHIFMRGLTKHIPIATFRQNADYVEAACVELADASTDLADLLTGDPSGLVVTTADCDTLADIYDLVHMRGPICNETLTYPNVTVINGPFPPVVIDVSLDYVQWETTGFADFGGVFCRFVGSESDVFQGSFYFQGATEYSYCQMPAFSNSSITAQLQISADSTSWSDPYDIAIVGMVNFTALEPASGPIEGGTTLEISGSGFFNNFTGCNPFAELEGVDCAICLFSWYNIAVVPVPATIISPSLARCVTPPWNVFEATNKTVQVWLTMNYFVPIGPMVFEYKQVAQPVQAPGTPSGIRVPIQSAPKPNVVSSANAEAIASTLVWVIGLVAVMLF